MTISNSSSPSWIGRFQFDPRLEELEDSKAQVTEIFHYSTPLDGFMGGMGIHHDFIVITVDYLFHQGKAMTFQIRAEKLKITPSKATEETDETGIRVTYLEKFDTEGVTERASRRGFRATILMRDLLDLLDHDNPCYNVFTANCWGYAMGTHKKLVRVLITNQQS